MLDTGRLDRITTFQALIDYLRDELDWPIQDFSFEDLTYEWNPSEFGLKENEISGAVEIKQLRPLGREPWGIFFLSLPHKKLPVTVLRRILGGLAVKKRASANAADRAAWNKEDLLFIAAQGAGDERSLAFAHFHEDKEHGDLPTLRVLGWDGADTIRRLSDTHRTLKDKLHWAERGEDEAHWRARWNEAFREKPGEVIATSKALAKELAHLAREIRRRANELLEEESDKGPLRTLHNAFKEALIHDLKFDDFADMYAQTIAYGLLAARISRESGALVADNAADLAPPTNPFLKELLETFLSAGGRKGGMDFDELGVNDVVEMLRRADMHAVLLDFDTKNPSEDPVIHFYELFLKEYDAKKRMQRGVFYTPRPVVSFIVRSVDEILRTDFGLEDGLASSATWGEVIAAKRDMKLPDGAKETDPFVRILDPATGTGTFLVEAVDLIHRRMIEKWRNAGKSANDIEALWNDYVPNHLLPRLYGFELMMAPYAIAHMKLGLKLAETGYHFGSNERARIYLTNALEPAQDFDMQLAFMSEALAHEAQAANKAKEVRFTVVIGNPPYAGESGNPSRDARGRLTHAGELIRPYFFVDGQPLGERNSKWINNDYVKFIAKGQATITRTGLGVLGYITSHSWLDGPIFRGARASLIETFPSMSMINCHGNINRKERTPQGGPDEGVFEIEEGTNITIAARGASAEGFRIADLWGTCTSKFDWLASNVANSHIGSETAPRSPKWLFERAHSDDRMVYDAYPSIVDVMPVNGAGMVTARDGFVIGFDAAPLLDRVERFATSKLNDSAVCAELEIPEKLGWDVASARAQLRAEKDLKKFIRRVLYRPLDWRLIFYHDAVVWRTVRKIMSNFDEPNVGFITTKQTKDQWGIAAADHMIAHKALSAYDISSLFPLWLIPKGTDRKKRANIDPVFLRRLRFVVGLEFDETSERGDLAKTFGPRDVFDWIYAVLHSPAYRARYADYLKSDFARIPLPGSKALFQELVPLGTKLVALHLLDAAAAPELEDPQGVRFAGHGEARAEKKPEWCAAGGNRVTISAHRWFEGVPERVWNFHIGGYRPAEKWLKDRAAKGGKKASPGRTLTAEDQLHYRRMVVAMDKTIDLMAEIDRVIEKHGGWPDAFRGMSEGAADAAE
jgi:predicted helicase